MSLALFFIPPFIAGTIAALSSGIVEDLQRRPPPPFLARLMSESIDAVPLFGEWGPVLGLWSLAAAGFTGYARALPFLGQRVRDLKEQFLEAT